MGPKKGSSRQPAHEGGLSDMWWCNGPNSWTHAGKVEAGTSLNGAGGLYAEEDFKVGSTDANMFVQTYKKLRM